MRKKPLLLLITFENETGEDVEIFWVVIYPRIKCRQGRETMTSDEKESPITGPQISMDLDIGDLPH